MIYNLGGDVLKEFLCVMPWMILGECDKFFIIFDNDTYVVLVRYLTNNVVFVILKESGLFEG